MTATPAMMAAGIEIHMGDPAAFPVDLYRASAEEMSGVSFIRARASTPSIYHRLEKGDLDVIPWVKPENRLRRWEKSTGGSISLTLEDGSPLPMGLYGVEYHYLNSDNKVSRDGFALSVANAAITIKRAPENSLIWVTDIETARPIPNAAITVYQSGDVYALGGSWPAEVIATGQTNADGVFMLEKQIPTYDYLFITAEGPDIFGAWFSSSPRVLPPTRGYLYTDRPAYLPGETVYFRGVLRDRRDMDYTVPAGLKTIHITAGEVHQPFVVHPEPRLFYKADLPVSEFGTFSGSFTLPEDIEVNPLSTEWLMSDTASYEITANFDAGEVDSFCHMGYVWGFHCRPYAVEPLSVTFEAAAALPPDLVATLTPEENAVIMGRPLTLKLSVTDRAGKPVQGASGQWVISGSATPFQYHADPSYDFPCEEFSSDSGDIPPTDASGETYVTLPETTFHYQCAQISALVEVVVTGPNGEITAAYARVVARLPDDYVLVGRYVDSKFQELPNPFNIDLITVFPTQVAVPNQEITVQVSEISTRAILETTLVTTGQDGRAVFTFVPPQPVQLVVDIAGPMGDGVGVGGWLISMLSYDPHEPDEDRWQIAEWFCDTDRNDRQEYSPCVVPRRNAAQYQPGDTAQVLIPNPYADGVTALVTLERASVMSYKMFHITDSYYVDRFTVTDAYAPTVYDSVVLLPPLTGSEKSDFLRDFITGEVELPVESDLRRLTITLTPSPEVAAPGETVTVDIAVTDHSGRPVRAEVGLALIDEAVPEEIRMWGTRESLEESFYGPQYLFVGVTTSLESLFPGRSQPDYGSYDLWPDYFLRMGLPAGRVHTPFWSPQVVTDEFGRASVTVQLPDYPARWRLDARAVTPDTLVGQAQMTLSAE